MRRLGASRHDEIGIAAIVVNKIANTGREALRVPLALFHEYQLILASHKKRARQQQKQANHAAKSAQEHRRVGEMQDRAKAARERVEQAKTSQTRTTRKVEFSFLMTELNTGLGLAAIALSAADTDTFNRQRQRARAAYDTVLRFRDRVPLTKEQSRDMNGKLASLKEHLAQLGESL